MAAVKAARKMRRKLEKYDGNPRGVGNAVGELGGYFCDGRLKNLDGWIMP